MMVGLRLLLLSWWTPEYFIRRELENISEKTTKELQALITKHKAEPPDQSTPTQQHSKNLQEQRVAMAQNQARLVTELAAAVGEEEAVKLGRQALFSLGQSLGKKSRNRLGISDNPLDLAKAAKILYRILGIEFHIEWQDPTSATLIIDKCPLAKQYSKLTCQILSATDEGVINGMQPKLVMKFREYITNGCKNCSADINIKTEENKN